MTAPATPAPAAAPSPAGQTHPCARCGAPVALDVGLCERCNPLGLKDSASSQVHGTVILTVGVAIALLAVFARLTVSGIGPFEASVPAVRADPGGSGLVATFEVRNAGRSAGVATCRVSDPSDPALVHSLVVYSPRLEPGQTIRWDQPVSFGTPEHGLRLTCQTP
jgi:hypothetical protein